MNQVGRWSDSSSPPVRKWEVAFTGILVLILTVGAAVGGWTLVERHRLESAPWPVELTMDWDALAERAATWPVGPAEALKELAREGLSSVAVREVTPGLLEAQGRALVVTEAEREAWQRLLGITAGAPPVQPGILLPLPEGMAAGGPTWVVMPGAAPVRVPLKPGDARGYGMGWPPDAVAAAEASRVALVLRYGSRPRHEPVFPDVGPARRLSRVTIFEGDRIPLDAEPDLAGRMEARGIALGMVEFAPQVGAADLARRLNGHAVVVHSAPPAAYEASTPDALLARMTRAVQERGVRLLYLRPMADLPQTVALVKGLRERLAAIGHPVGLTQPAPLRTGPPPYMGAWLGASLGALVVWAAVAWNGSWRRRPWATVLLGAAITVAGALGAGASALATRNVMAGSLPVLLRQGLALLAAMAVPATACGVALQLQRRGRPVLASAGALVGVAVLGGALSAALLSDTLFMLRLEQFRGVKLAHALPPLAVAVLAAGVAGLGWSGWLGYLRRPVRWGDVLVAALVGAAGLYYLLRTGNEFAPVAGIEAMLRGTLESGLGVRPRTKEFLIGYPALALALWMGRAELARRWPVAFGALWAAASLVPVSIFNSWMHLHTPVAMTLLRIGYGAGLGLLTGAILWGLAEVVSRRTAARRWLLPTGGAESSPTPAHQESGAH